MKSIPLSNGRRILVDDEDFEKISQFRWYAHLARHTHYARRSIYLGGFRGDYKRKVMYMHRFILDAPKGMEIDHINHNGLDNRRKNIRICTRSQNGKNIKKNSGSSKFKGVSLDTRSKKWTSQIRANNKVINLGNFLKEKDAARAYNKAAKLYHGEFAYLNKGLN